MCAVHQGPTGKTQLRLIPRVFIAISELPFFLPMVQENLLFNRGFVVTNLVVFQFCMLGTLCFLTNSNCCTHFSSVVLEYHDFDRASRRHLSLSAFDPSAVDILVISAFNRLISSHGLVLNEALILSKRRIGPSPLLPTPASSQRNLT